MGDVIQVTAVGSGLFGQGLEQARLQGQQFLGILDAHHGLGMVAGFSQGSLGSGQIEFDNLLDAFKRLARQAEQGFDIGFVGSNDLFNGQHVRISNKN